MSLYNNTPVFLTTDSGFDKRQCESVNVIVRTARNRFYSKAKQTQKEKPRIVKFITSKYARVLNLLDYQYGNNFSISFILNPGGLSNGIEYPLFEFDGNVSAFQYQGSHDENVVARNLTSLGTITISKKFAKPTFVFTPTDMENWPKNDDHYVAYSVYIGGRI